MKHTVKKEYSPFAYFIEGTKGYDFKTKKGRQLDKWEVFEMGYTNAKKVINNKTRIIATARPDELV